MAKLKTYRVSKNCLRLIQNYLSERQQSVKVGLNFSEWLEVIIGAPFGSILKPFIVNVFINVFLFFTN